MWLWTWKRFLSAARLARGPLIRVAFSTASLRFCSPLLLLLPLLAAAAASANGRSSSAVLASAAAAAA
jgi:hypothetical protein